MFYDLFDQFVPKKETIMLIKCAGQHFKPMSQWIAPDVVTFRGSVTTPNFEPKRGTFNRQHRVSNQSMEQYPTLNQGCCDNSHRMLRHRFDDAHLSANDVFHLHNYNKHV